MHSLIYENLLTLLVLLVIFATNIISFIYKIMSLLKKVNIYRRGLMKGITKNIGESKLTTNGEKINKDEVKRILITRPNHRLGNQLLITPLIQELTNTFPNATIDLFLKGGVGNILFENYTQIDQKINLPKKHFKELGKYISGWLRLKKYSYDIVINVAKNSSSGRLSTKLANAKYKFFGLEEFEFKNKFENLNHIAKFPVYSFRENISYLGIQPNLSSIPSLKMILSEKELAKGKDEVSKLKDKEAKTIALFTYATGEKCYSKEWWAAFYEDLKHTLPNYNIIEVLPVENVSQLNFSIPSYYSKDVREICSFFANCDVFIGADSGIMHLATASGVPTLGLFSVTQPDTYQPYGNQSKGIDTKVTSNAKIIEEAKQILESN